MGTGLFIIDAVIIAIVILPFVLFINGSHKRKSQLRKALQAEAAQNNCKLTQFEVHGDFAIGVDANAQKLFFYKKMTESGNTKIVDLKSVAACKYIRDTKQVKDKTKHYDVIQKVELSFIHHNQNDVTKIELYDNDGEMTLNGEIALAQKWEDIVNQLIKTSVASDVEQKQEHLNMAIN